MEPAKNLQPVSTLIGVWEGDGRGAYPTIQDFSYREEVTFADIGKPFLEYRQRTWAPDGKLMHVESGYLRITSPTTAEFVLALPTGQVELCEGSITVGERLQIDIDGKVLNSSTAKHVDATQRSYIVEGDQLTTVMHMAAVGKEMGFHLESVLQRKG